LVAIGALIVVGLMTKIIPLPKATTKTSGVADIGGPFILTTHRGDTLTPINGAKLERGS
jgi:hypothetical protein